MGGPLIHKVDLYTSKYSNYDNIYSGKKFIKIIMYIVKSKKLIN